MSPSVRGSRSRPGVTPPANSQSSTAPAYAPNGDLLAPVGFDTWVFVGSNHGLAYRQGLPVMTTSEAKPAEAPQFHNNPEAYAAFRATGEFPIPTIKVMEKFAAADKEPRGIVASGVFNGDRVGGRGQEPASSRPQHHRMGLLRFHRLNGPVEGQRGGFRFCRRRLRGLSSTACEQG